MKNCTIVIVNWNGEKHLSTFIPSVVAHSGDAAILVFDNGSSDGSVVFLRQNYPQIQIVAHTLNEGFAKGNNLALKYVTTPFVVLLNSDVEVTPGWLAPLIQKLEESPKIAAVQPKIRSYAQKTKFEYAGASGGYLDCYGYPYCRGRIFDELEDDSGQYDEAQKIFWATGACLALRMDVVAHIGLFDERFFAHWEEIDFCWRAQNAGYQIWVCPQSVVYHVGGGTLVQNSPRKIYLNFRNSLATLLKNLPLRQAIPMLFIRMVLDGAAACKGLLGGDWRYFLQILKSHFGFYGMIGYCLGSRSKRTFKPLKDLDGVTSKSVVWQYFGKKNKKYSDIHN